MSDPEAIIRIEGVFKKFKVGQHTVGALKNIHLNVYPRQFLAIAGSSGSGKTTLLNLMGCLDEPTQGQIYWDSINVSELGSTRLAELRAQKIGFIFQTFNLIPVLTAMENVEYPLLLLGKNRKERRQLCVEALERVGLGSFLHHRPDQLSGGQRQRVAIARALVKAPRLILADEPTANLDAKTAGEILTTMDTLNDTGVTFVFTSHDPVILSRAKQVVYLRDGEMVDKAESHQAVKE